MKEGIVVKTVNKMIYRKCFRNENKLMQSSVYNTVMGA